MEYRIRPAQDSDAESIAEIFNHFVLNTFFAYPSIPVDKGILQRMKALAGKLPVYVAEDVRGSVVGFAGLRALHFADTLARSAELTIFILPDHTGKGLGSLFLAELEREARALGVDTIIGGASSFNQPSLDFQSRHGFTECGRFKRVGCKFDKDFDIVWMQKLL